MYTIIRTVETSLDCHSEEYHQNELSCFTAFKHLMIMNIILNATVDLVHHIASCMLTEYC